MCSHLWKIAPLPLQPLVNGVLQSFVIHVMVLCSSLSSIECCSAVLCHPCYGVLQFFVIHWMLVCSPLSSMLWCSAVLCHPCNGILQSYIIHWMVFCSPMSSIECCSAVLCHPCYGVLQPFVIHVMVFCSHLSYMVWCSAVLCYPRNGVPAGCVLRCEVSTAGWVQWPSPSIFCIVLIGTHTCVRPGIVMEEQCFWDFSCETNWMKGSSLFWVSQYSSQNSPLSNLSHRKRL